MTAVREPSSRFWSIVEHPALTTCLSHCETTYSAPSLARPLTETLLPYAHIDLTDGMPSNSPQHDDAKPLLRVVLDDGSGLLKVVAQHVPAGARVDKQPIDILELNVAKQNQLEQIISWDEDEDVMLYGEHEVSQKLRQDRHAPVRTDWKLEASACHLGDVSLGSDGRSEGLRTGLDLSRNRSKIWQLLRFNKRRFEEMRHRILKYYKEYSPKGFMVGPQYWDEIQIELMVTVPAIWNQGARNMILNSATAAGFQNVRLYLEPHCAAALEMGMLMPRDGSRGYIDLNTIIAWFDIGHATNDWSAVRIRKPETEAAQPELQIAGAPTGGMAGSHVVHDLAWRHVLMSREVAAQGGLDEVLARLGGLNTEAEFRRQVNRKIEEEKKRPSPERFTLTVYGNEVWQDSEDPMERFDVEIFPEDVQSWLNEWADRLGEELERSLAETHSRLGEKIHGIVVRRWSVQRDRHGPSEAMCRKTWRGPQKKRRDVPRRQGRTQAIPSQRTGSDSHWILLSTSQRNIQPVQTPRCC